LRREGDGNYCNSFSFLKHNRNGRAYMMPVNAIRATEIIPRPLGPQFFFLLPPAVASGHRGLFRTPWMFVETQFSFKLDCCWSSFPCGAVQKFQ
jgi:hypothetical protein